jgi:hypothetical protein
MCKFLNTKQQTAKIITKNDGGGRGEIGGGLEIGEVREGKGRGKG